MTTKLIATLMTLPLVLTAAIWVKLNAAPAAKAKTYHVVFEMTEPEPVKWAGTIKNVDHLIEALGAENVDVEVVMHGPGIAAVTKDQGASFASDFERLRKEGVFLAACHNSLEGKHIPLSSVQASFTVVPSGVAEVVKKQHDGWQYLKAAW
ncbi:MAG TPA: DsrE family protein [Bryobacteraceae bacterium]|nr:DsrE family protein [Bryobacteraceae bacterium]